MCQVSVVCFKFLTLIIFEIHGTQKSSFFPRNVKNFVCMNRPHDCYAWSIACKICKWQFRKVCIP